jgi:hypothetical protein
MRNDWTVGRVVGVTVQVHWTFLILIACFALTALLAVELAAPSRPVTALAPAEAA